VGTDVALIYESLQSPQATDHIIGNIATGLAGKITNGRLRRRVARRVIKGTLDIAAAHVASRERRSTEAALSPDATRGLRGYLEGPLRQQLMAECHGDPPSNLTFAFGHTHKPFVDVVDAAGYANPVQVMNTGGWVVDGLIPEPLHGAAAVLVDENANAVLLRFYAQRADPAEYRVEVETPPGAPDSEFARRMRAFVKPDKKPWSDLSERVALVVAQRNNELLRLIQLPTSSTSR
jgi:hypothetical protein